MRPYALRNLIAAIMLEGIMLVLLILTDVSIAWAMGSPSVLSVIVASVMSLGALLILWGGIIEPERMVVHSKQIDLPIKNLRIAVASDFHVGIFHGKTFMEMAVRHINATKPDLILLPGDFLDDECADITALAPLANLQARYGVFAVTGNHDAGAYVTHFGNKPYHKKDRTSELQTLLTSYGITFLRNQAKTVTIDNQTLIIAGTDDPFMGSCDPDTTLKNVPSNTPVILLSHSPDVILFESAKRANVIVTGHTHGGQIRLPLIGPLYIIPDRVGKKYDRGLFAITKTCTLAISEGVGVTGVRARLFCPPEVLVLQTK